MAMTKKDLIKLADYVKRSGPPAIFTADHLSVLADFCRSQNGRFMRDRWLAYIAGECGPSGGDVQKFYVSTYCNFAHDLKTGRPIKHECRNIPPAALKAEMAGDYQKAIQIMQGKRGIDCTAAQDEQEARATVYQPKTGQRCHCKPGVERDNCPECEGTGMKIDFAAIRAARKA